MITINEDLFIWILAIWIFIASITKIFAGIVSNGETRTYSLFDSLDGMIGVILILICVIL